MQTATRSEQMRIVVVVVVVLDKSTMHLPSSKCKVCVQVPELI